MWSLAHLRPHFHHQELSSSSRTSRRSLFISVLISRIHSRKVFCFTEVLLGGSGLMPLAGKLLAHLQTSTSIKFYSRPAPARSSAALRRRHLNQVFFKFLQSRFPAFFPSALSSCCWRPSKVNISQEKKSSPLVKESEVNDISSCESVSLGITTPTTYY